MAFNNSLAKVDCLKHPGALQVTTSCYMWGGDCSHGWKILATQPEALTQKGEKQAPVTLKKKNSGKRRRDTGRGGGKEGGTASVNSLHIQENANAQENMD